MYGPYFTSPQSNGTTGTGYVRSIDPSVNPAKISVTGATGRNLFMLAPDGSTIAGPAVTTSPFSWTPDWPNLGDGAYLPWLDGAPNVLGAMLYVVKGTPSLAPQTLYVTFGNMISDGQLAQGYAKLAWPGPTPPYRSFPYALRKATSANGVNPPYANWWCQVMAGSGAGAWEFVREWSTSYPGVPTIATKQLYQHYQQESPVVPRRDGPRGVATTGNPVCGEVDAESTIFITDSEGSVYTCDVRGNVETWAGNRSLPGPFRRNAEADTDATHQAWARAQFELVGDWSAVAKSGFAGPWAGCRDQRNPKTIAYVVDSQNDRVLKLDRTSGTTKVTLLADIAAYCTAQDPMQMLPVHPMGIAQHPTENWLAIGADHFCGILKLDPDTGAISTLVRSAVVPQMGTLPALSFSTIKTFMRPNYSTPGPFGMAIFMHPGQMGFTSDNRLVVAIHHTFEWWIFDLAKQTASRMWQMDDNGLTAIGGSGAADYTICWPSLSVDRWGTSGKVDNVIHCWWKSQPVLYCHAIDGTAGIVVKPPMNQPVPALREGPGDHIIPPGYPQMVAFGPAGEYWVGDAIQGTLRRFTLRQATDPPVPNATNFAAGRAAWYSPGPAGEAPFMLLHGLSLSNQLGCPLGDELAAMDMATLAAYLRGFQPTLSDATIANIQAFIRGQFYAWQQPEQGTPPLQEPTGFQVRELTLTTVHTSWDHVPNAASYVLHASTDGSDPDGAPPIYAGIQTSYTFAGAPGTTYRLCPAGVDAQGNVGPCCADISVSVPA